MPPLALSDEQLDRVMAAASMLPVTSRDAFLKSVAGRVAGVPYLGMDPVEHAIAVVLGIYGVAGGHRAFVQPKRSKAND
jgi:hypothetical protein